MCLVGLGLGGGCRWSDLFVPIGVGVGLVCCLGETCFSVKGSPLKSSAFTAPTTVRATVKANRSGSSASLSESAIKASTISIELPAATGGIVDVSDAESLKQALEGDATGEMKADAHAKLKSLQDEVAAMLQTIGGA